MSPTRGTRTPPTRTPPTRKRPQPQRGKGASRTRQHAPVPRPRPNWWQQPWVIPAAVLAVAAVLVVAVLAGRSGSTPGGGSSPGLPNGALTAPAPAGLVSTVTSVKASTFSAVGDGGVDQPFKAITGTQQPLTGPGGKPLLLYIGADYCPYCAAERWSLVLALSRFGQVGGLALTTSATNDAFPDTNTFNFSHLTFTSSVLEVQAVELKDRTGQNLQTPDHTQAAIYAAVDKPPYSSTAGGIPFLDIGQRFVGGLSNGFGPQDLQGLSWDQIAQKLSDPNDPVTKGIVGLANRITAGICAVTGNQPASVCQAPAIQQLVTQLPSS